MNLHLMIARLLGIASLLAALIAVYSGLYWLDARDPEFAVTVISEIVGLTCGIIAIVQWRDHDGRSDLPALVLGIIGCALAVLLAVGTFLVLIYGSLAHV